ncbi:hypothetical protein Tco_0228842 [Tanacetum coccineum]
MVAEVPQTLKYKGGQLNVAPLIEEFQDSPDDEEDTRSSQEYMNDLEMEFHKRALLTKSKRFFKDDNQRFIGAKATDQTECFKCDEEEVSSNDNEKVEVKVLMALADDESGVDIKIGTTTILQLHLPIVLGSPANTSHSQLVDKKFNSFSAKGFSEDVRQLILRIDKSIEDEEVSLVDGVLEGALGALVVIDDVFGLLKALEMEALVDAIDVDNELRALPRSLRGRESYEFVLNHKGDNKIAIFIGLYRDLTIEIKNKSWNNRFVDLKETIETNVSEKTLDVVGFVVSLINNTTFVNVAVFNRFVELGNDGGPGRCGVLCGWWKVWGVVLDVCGVGVGAWGGLCWWRVWVCEVVIGWGGGLGGVECGGDECCGDGGGRCYFVGCVLGRRLGGRVVVAFVGGYGRWLNLEEYWGFEVGGVVYGEDRVVWMGGLLALGMGEGFGVGWLVIGDV